MFASKLKSNARKSTHSGKSRQAVTPVLSRHCKGSSEFPHLKIDDDEDSPSSHSNDRSIWDTQFPEPELEPVDSPNDVIILSPKPIVKLKPLARNSLKHCLMNINEKFKSDRNIFSTFSESNLSATNFHMRKQPSRFSLSPTSVQVKGKTDFVFKKPTAPPPVLRMSGSLPTSHKLPPTLKRSQSLGALLNSRPKKKRLTHRTSMSATAHLSSRVSRSRALLQARNSSILKTARFSTLRNIQCGYNAKCINYDAPVLEYVDCTEQSDCLVTNGNSGPITSHQTAAAASNQLTSSSKKPVKKSVYTKSTGKVSSTRDFHDHFPRNTLSRKHTPHEAPTLPVIDLCLSDNHKMKELKQLIPPRQWNLASSKKPALKNVCTKSTMKLSTYVDVSDCIRRNNPQVKLSPEMDIHVRLPTRDLHIPIIDLCNSPVSDTRVIGNGTLSLHVSQKGGCVTSQKDVGAASSTSGSYSHFKINASKTCRSTLKKDDNKHSFHKSSPSSSEISKQGSSPKDFTPSAPSSRSNANKNTSCLTKPNPTILPVHLGSHVLVKDFAEFEEVDGCMLVSFSTQSGLESYLENQSKQQAKQQVKLQQGKFVKPNPPADQHESCLLENKNDKTEKQQARVTKSSAVKFSLSADQESCLSDIKCDQTKIKQYEKCLIAHLQERHEILHPTLVRHGASIMKMFSTNSTCVNLRKVYGLRIGKKSSKNKSSSKPVEMPDSALSTVKTSKIKDAGKPLAVVDTSDVLKKEPPATCTHKERIPLSQSIPFIPFEKEVVSTKSAFISDALEKYLQEEVRRLNSKEASSVRPILQNKTCSVTFSLPSTQCSYIKTLDMALKERQMARKKTKLPTVAQTAEKLARSLKSVSVTNIRIRPVQESQSPLKATQCGTKVLCKRTSESNNVSKVAKDVSKGKMNSNNVEPNKKDPFKPREDYLKEKRHYLEEKLEYVKQKLKMTAAPKKRMPDRFKLKNQTNWATKLKIMNNQLIQQQNPQQQKVALTTTNNGEGDLNNELLKPNDVQSCSTCYVDGQTEENQSDLNCKNKKRTREFVKLDHRVCDKPFCRMGCICESINLNIPVERLTKHCRKVDCMIECTCQRVFENVRILRNRKKPRIIKESSMLLYDGPGLFRSSSIAVNHAAKQSSQLDNTAKSTSKQDKSGGTCARFTPYKCKTKSSESQSNLEAPKSVQCIEDKVPLSTVISSIPQNVNSDPLKVGTILTVDKHVNSAIPSILYAPVTVNNAAKTGSFVLYAPVNKLPLVLQKQDKPNTAIVLQQPSKGNVVGQLTNKASCGLFPGLSNICKSSDIVTPSTSVTVCQNSSPTTCVGTTACHQSKIAEHATNISQMTIGATTEFVTDLSECNRAQSSDDRLSSCLEKYPLNEVVVTKVKRNYLPMNCAGNSVNEPTGPVKDTNPCITIFQSLSGHATTGLCKGWPIKFGTNPSNNVDPARQGTATRVIIKPTNVHTPETLNVSKSTTTGNSNLSFNHQTIEVPALPFNKTSTCGANSGVTKTQVFLPGKSSSSVSSKDVRSPLMIEIQSECNWNDDKNNILSTIAKHTATKDGSSNCMRIGKYMIEILGKTDNETNVEASNKGDLKPGLSKSTGDQNGTKTTETTLTVSSKPQNILKRTWHSSINHVVNKATSIASTPQTNTTNRPVNKQYLAEAGTLVSQQIRSVPLLTTLPPGSIMLSDGKSSAGYLVPLSALQKSCISPNVLQLKTLQPNGPSSHKTLQSSESNTGVLPPGRQLHVSACTSKLNRSVKSQVSIAVAASTLETSQGLSVSSDKIVTSKASTSGNDQSLTLTEVNVHNPMDSQGEYTSSDSIKRLSAVLPCLDSNHLSSQVSATIPNLDGNLEPSVSIASATGTCMCVPTMTVMSHDNDDTWIFSKIKPFKPNKIITSFIDKPKELDIFVDVESVDESTRPPIPPITLKTTSNPNAPWTITNILEKLTPKVNTGSQEMIKSTFVDKDEDDQSEFVDVEVIDENLTRLAILGRNGKASAVKNKQHLHKTAGSGKRKRKSPMNSKSLMCFEEPEFTESFFELSSDDEEDNNKQDSQTRDKPHKMMHLIKERQRRRDLRGLFRVLKNLLVTDRNAKVPKCTVLELALKEVKNLELQEFAMEVERANLMQTNYMKRSILANLSHCDIQDYPPPPLTLHKESNFLEYSQRLRSYSNDSPVFLASSGSNSQDSEVNSPDDEDYLTERQTRMSYVFNDALEESTQTNNNLSLHCDQSKARPKAFCKSQETQYPVPVALMAASQISETIARSSDDEIDNLILDTNLDNGPVVLASNSPGDDGCANLLNGCPTTADVLPIDFLSNIPVDDSLNVYRHNAPGNRSTPDDCSHVSSHNDPLYVTPDEPLDEPLVGPSISPSHRDALQIDTTSTVASLSAHQIIEPMDTSVNDIKAINHSPRISEEIEETLCGSYSSNNNRDSLGSDNGMGDSILVNNIAGLKSNSIDAFNYESCLGDSKRSIGTPTSVGKANSELTVQTSIDYSEHDPVDNVEDNGETTKHLISSDVTIPEKKHFKESSLRVNLETKIEENIVKQTETISHLALLEGTLSHNGSEATDVHQVLCATQEMRKNKRKTSSSSCRDNKHAKTKSLGVSRDLDVTSIKIQRGVVHVTCCNGDVIPLALLKATSNGTMQVAVEGDIPSERIEELLLKPEVMEGLERLADAARRK